MRLCQRCIFFKPHVEGAEGDVLHHAWAKQLIVGVLKQVGGADTHLLEIGLDAPLAAKREYPPLARLLETYNRAQKRRLARSIGANDSETLASFEL